MEDSDAADTDDAATRLAEGHVASDDRFALGTLLEARYRIEGRLGRGGMGEVYRAYDLTLAQTVALKFLPVDLADTAPARDRLRQEVRLARQVSHPNVCRVYDIGEAGGAPFLSMEYVDGEDLASLLRRIGRLPPDKALDIARKLCAGLAAAHEKGVLHRDLKPANIMIDGRGEVLVTDFGLAAIAGNVPATRVREGTRAYMSPEQLAGQEVTVRSDLYALGLVLYEIFTGKRAFVSRTEAELARLQRESTPTSIASIAGDVDPAVERTILRCLAHDPRQRPASAKQVALALPGGDPLAAAIAAGETPSPEMVANAGATEGQHPAIAVSLGAGVIALLLVSAVWHGPSVLDRTPFDNSPESLATTAREIAGRLGYTARPADTAFGFSTSGRYFNYARSHYSVDRIWAQIGAARPAPLTFWYRQSPGALDPGAEAERVSLTEPALDHAGMLRLSTDLEGRLLSFEAMPSEHEVLSGPPPVVNWAPLFTAAGLDPERFQPADPEWTPLMAFDARAAWTGAWPEATEVPLRIEAAAWRGRPVSFRIVEPWTVASRDATSQRGWDAETIAVYFVLFPIACVLARGNVRRRRADRTGALRLAIAVFGLDMASDLLMMTHVAGGTEFWRLVLFFGADLTQAALVAVLYLALEPYVRQQCPRLLVGWTRLLQGGFRDPLVGRHVLIGLLVSLTMGMGVRVQGLVQVARGSLPLPPFVPSGLLGARVLMGALVGSVYSGLFFAMEVLFLFFVARMLLRRDWLAGLGLVVLIVVIDNFGDWSLVNVAIDAAIVGVMSTILIRFGFLTTLSIWVFNTLLSTGSILTLDASRWYFGSSLTVLVVAGALAVYACRIALGGRSIFGAGATVSPR